MALSRGRSSEIPSDAVILSEDEALRYQWKIICEWDKPSEVWALRHTAPVLAALSSASGIYLNNHYRTKLRLGNYGKLSTYLPIVVIPAIFSMLTHKFFVQKSVILDPLERCPLCMQLRAGSFQAGFGVIYPTILAPLSSFMFATRHFTYSLPSLTERPLEVLQLWRKMTRPIIPFLGMNMLGQAIIAMYLTYKQMEQNLSLQLKVQAIERRIEEELKF